MKHIWRNSEDHYTPGNTTRDNEVLPSGIYEIVDPTMQTPWMLNRTRDLFVFPFKIYGLRTDLVNRIWKTWQNTTTNLGIALNGLRGSGKSITLQEIANNGIVNFNMPVIIVRKPINYLNEILTSLKQDIIVVFDEFEKTHHKPEEQQALLTLIDGLDRSEYRRLWLFSTNNLTIDENFKDRPSRIRYTINFEGLDPNLILEIVDDLLHPNLVDYRNRIFIHLMTRKVRTIDIVKAVLHEVNLYTESPEEVNKYLNFSTEKPEQYDLVFFNQSGEEIDRLAFKPASSYERYMTNYLHPQTYQQGMETYSNIYGSTFSPIYFLKIADFDGDYLLAQLFLKTSNLPWYLKASEEIRDLLSDNIQLKKLPSQAEDTPPEITKFLRKKNLSEKEQEIVENLGSIGNEYEAFRIKIEPNFGIGTKELLLSKIANPM